jgi:hypothetical protein
MYFRISYFEDINKIELVTTSSRWYLWESTKLGLVNNYKQKGYMHCSYFLGISQKRACDERNKGEEDALSKARKSRVVIDASSNGNICSSIHPTSSKPIYDIIRHESLPSIDIICRRFI